MSNVVHFCEPRRSATEGRGGVLAGAVDGAVDELYRRIIGLRDLSTGLGQASTRDRPEIVAQLHGSIEDCLHQIAQLAVLIDAERASSAGRGEPPIRRRR